jgi:hypothetical protein
MTQSINKLMDEDQGEIESELMREQLAAAKAQREYYEEKRRRI